MKLDLKHAEEILNEYEKPYSMIDNGNLFFAALEYKAAYEQLLKASDKLSNEFKHFVSGIGLRDEAIEAITDYEAFEPTRE